MLKKFRMRRVCTQPSPLTYPSNKKSDGTYKFATTGSVDGCSLGPETQFVGSGRLVDSTRVVLVGGFSSNIGAARVRPEFDIRPPSWTSHLIFPHGYLLKSFSQGNTTARQRRLYISVFLLGKGFLTCGEFPTCGE